MFSLDRQSMDKEKKFRFRLEQLTVESISHTFNLTKNRLERSLRDFRQESGKSTVLIHNLLTKPLRSRQKTSLIWKALPAELFSHKQKFCNLMKRKLMFLLFSVCHVVSKLSLKYKVYSEMTHITSHSKQSTHY